MSGSFLKFKRRLLAARLIKAVVSGTSVAMLLLGGWLVAWKLTLIDLAPMLAYGICISAAVIVAGATYLLLHMSDRRLAVELDTRFDLQEKVQTMVAFRNEHGGMLEMQREDTERSLASVRVRTFGLRRLWAFLLALCIGVSSFVVGLLVENRRDYEPPEEIVPFEISAMQIAGIEELIRYVDTSAMEKPYREEISSSLTVLLSELKLATTEPQMEAALATALTAITETTYASSSMAEILDAMWKTDESHVRALALALDTSKWTDPDWGDFAERYEAFRASFRAKEGEESTVQSVKWKTENVVLKLGGALDASKIEKKDPLYAVLDRMMNGAEAEGASFDGLLAIVQKYAAAESADVVLSAVDGLLERTSEDLYNAISTQKVNTNVGEYVLKKLATLFGMPIPTFERPQLLTDNAEDTDGDSDREDEDGPSGGGVGEGVVFGSNDLVLDPLTGEYVEYGTLYATYNTLMIEKLGDDKYGYTEEQKRAIEKYFALLYGGFKNEEGNEHE